MTLDVVMQPILIIEGKMITDNRFFQCHSISFFLMIYLYRLHCLYISTIELKEKGIESDTLFFFISLLSAR
jgi:hypothetical protein